MQAQRFSQGAIVMHIDTSKVRKSISLVWMIGALLLILFAARTGDAFVLTSASSIDAGSSPAIAVTTSNDHSQTAGQRLD
jgi:hypothetical protein